jgi:hypothetical protein
MIILAYIGNVFLNRWLNKIVYKKNIAKIEVFTWFIPVLVTIAFILVLLNHFIEKKSNWFIGKHW